MGREYCQAHGYAIIAEMPESDKGASGAEIDLPVLNQIREMARRGEFDVLVVRELDRLSRNLAKQLIVEEELKRYGVSIEYVLGDYADTPEGRLQKHIRATVAEYEREKIKERIARGKKNIVKSGKVMLNSCPPPYGYRLSEQGSLDIYEPEAKIIRLIFDWYIVGDETGTLLSTHKIAKRLSDMAVPTWCDIHGKPFKQRNYAQWTGPVISHILHNETYKGCWYYNKQNAKCKKNPRDMWMKVDVPAIVSLEQWELAQEQASRNRQTASHNIKHEYLMRFQLKCECTYGIIANTVSSKGKPHQYYQCVSVKGTRGLHGKCSLPTYRADHLDELVWNWLVDWFKDADDLKHKLEEYRQERDRANAPILSALKVNEDLIAENQLQLDRLLDLYQSGGLRKEKYLDRQVRLEETIARLERERGELQSRLAQELSQEQIDELVQFAHNLGKGLDNAGQSFEARRHIIELLGVRAILKIENGEKIVYASFVLTEGEVGERLVMPGRGKSGFVTDTMETRLRCPQSG